MKQKYTFFISFLSFLVIDMGNFLIKPRPQDANADPTPAVDDRPMTRTGALACFILGSIVIGRYYVPTTDVEKNQYHWKNFLDMTAYSAVACVGADTNRLLFPPNTRLLTCNNWYAKTMLFLSFYCGVFSFFLLAYAKKVPVVEEIFGSIFVAVPAAALMVYVVLCLLVFTKMISVEENSSM